jgi:hypothetical protein
LEYLKLGTPWKYFEYLEFGVLEVGDFSPRRGTSVCRTLDKQLNGAPEVRPAELTGFENLSALSDIYYYICL